MLGLSDLKWIVELLSKLLDYFFRYPVTIKYLGWYESSAGFIFDVAIESTRSKVIPVPKSAFRVRIKLDPEAVVKTDKNKVLYGESVEVFDSSEVLQAHIDGRSYGNVSRSVLCYEKPRHLYLFVTVAGPGSRNPSSRLQLGRMYQAMQVKLKRRFIEMTYAELPIPQISLVAGNDRTRIEES